jgi:hypothetical protein
MFWVFTNVGLSPIFVLLINKNTIAMKIYKNSDTTIPAAAQQELENALANIGYQGESVEAKRVRSYPNSEHYSIYGEDGEFLFNLDADADSPTIY